MRTTLALLALGAAPGVAAAQQNSLAASHPAWESTTPASRTTRLGVKGGVSWGDLQSTSLPVLTSQFDYLRTFHAGLYSQRGLTRFASVRAELLYSRKGYRDLDTRPVGSPLATNQLSYLALPVLFVGHLTETLSFHAGPQAALLLGASRDGQALDLPASDYRRLELGGVAGVEARLGPAWLGLRYDYSLAALNGAGTAVTTTGQLLQVLAADNNYHNLVLQAYLRLGLVH